MSRWKARRRCATLGFVDVPGHERFVHTMVAGATGIDVALLVVAADDGVMPQTREHLAILQLLGVDRGAVALTKIDRVDAARIARVEIEIAALLAGRRCRIPRVRLQQHAPMTQASTPCAPTCTHGPRRCQRAPGRAAQRAVPHAGGPRVLAGRPRHGGDRRGAWRRRRGGRAPAADARRHRCARAQHPRAEPGQRTRHGRAALRAEPGRHRPRRHSSWRLDRRPARAAGHHPRRRAPAAVRTATPLRDWAPLHIHWGTMHRQAHVVLLEDDDHGNGQLVQLVFDAPVCAMCGDRFIARDSAATHTLGGGVVLDPDPPQRRRRSPARLAWLGALEQLAAGAGIGPLLQQAPFGIAMAALQRYCRRAPTGSIFLQTRAHRHPRRHGGHPCLALAGAARAGDRLAACWHERRPDEPGVDSGRLQRSTLPALATSLWNALLQDLLDDGSVQRVRLVAPARP
jgi:selenocysteine-specific elongation factor